MAAITSAATGLWSATSTWVGGVVPGTADTVTIAATHVVTVDGTYITGGDTTTRFLITGTVKASRTVNSSLTIRAFIQINNVNGGFDYGTSTDPIPQGVTAELVINASATVVANKYQFDITNNASKMQFCGAPKTRNAFLTAPVSAGATSIQVTSASGWVVGNQLILEQPTNLVTTQTEIVTITSISGTTIGVSAITNARVSGLAVSNRTCNVIFRSQSLGTNVQIRQAPTTESTTTKTEFRNATVANIGFINMYNSSAPMTNMPVVDSCVILAETYNSTFLFQGNTLSGVSSANNNLFYHTATVGSGASFANINLCIATINNNVLYQYVTNSNAGTLGLSGAFSVTGDGNRFNVLSGAVQVGLGASNFTNTRIRVATASFGSAILANGAVNATFENLDINSNSTYYVQSAGAGSGDVTFFNPTFDSIDKFAMFLQSPSSHRVNVYNIGNALNVNRRYNTPTRAIGQSAVVSRGLSAIALSLLNSQPTGSYTFTFEGVNGVSQRIIGRLRHDTTYGTSNPPLISFSGAGVSSSFTSSSTVNLWEQFDITLTPTSTGTITATVTFAGAGGGTAYLDGIYHFPWITENWIYGFQKLAQVNSVVDPNVTLSESAVAALASSATLDDVYDSATYYSVSNFSGGYTVIATANGEQLNFGSKSVVINNGAASNFSYAGTTATIKSAALTSGTKFKSLAATGITMTTPVTNTNLTGNVAQTTPTNLTGVNITGNLTFNTNTPITVTFTSCNVSGTISNSGTGLVKVVKAGTTPWLTAGSNVNVIANVVVETPGGLALSTYIVKNGATDLGWVPLNAARALEIKETDTFQIYAIAYGFKAKLVNAIATDLTSFKFELLPEPFIDTSLSSVTRNIIAATFSTSLDAFNRIALAVNTDLRNYDPDEVMNAVQYYITTEGDLIAAGVLYGGTIDGVEIINGGILIGTPGFYGKVNDSITTVNDLGILIPIYVDIEPAVYVADPTYTPVKKNTSGIVLQTAPWTQMTADLSAVDKTDIRSGLALEASLALKADQVTVEAIENNTALIPALV